MLPLPLSPCFHIIKKEWYRQIAYLLSCPSCFYFIKTPTPFLNKLSLLSEGRFFLLKVSPSKPLPASLPPVTRMLPRFISIYQSLSSRAKRLQAISHRPLVSPRRDSFEAQRAPREDTFYGESVRGRFSINLQLTAIELPVRRVKLFIRPSPPDRIKKQSLCPLWLCGENSILDKHDLSTTSLPAFRESKSAHPFIAG